MIGCQKDDLSLAGGVPYHRFPVVFHSAFGGAHNHPYFQSPYGSHNTLLYHTGVEQCILGNMAPRGYISIFKMKRAAVCSMLVYVNLDQFDKCQAKCTTWLLCLESQIGCCDDAVQFL